MASLAAACRATTRLTSSRAAASRSFTASARCLAAQNFTMPALSPTMTEGNIANWNVKEGDSFSAGDVLLEIETDKATMDVEAQEDGIMMKIMAQSGSKAVQVGTRIAVMAESGDDITSMEIPADEPAPSSSSSKQQSSADKKEESSSSSAATSGSGGSAQKASGSGETHAVRYPLLPSVGHLVKEKGLSDEDVAKITPTGPGGRLLKGDILAYIGLINADKPGTLSSHFEKRSHLDLSNIKVAEKKPQAQKPDAETEQQSAAAAAAEQHLEVNIPVSMSKVVEVQHKIQETLGVFLPISTFISRAAELANDDLPPADREPTADELFDQVLGLDKIKATSSRGIYLPQISAIPPASSIPPPPPARKADIIDLLAPAPKKSPSRAAGQTVPTVPGLSNGANVFTLVVPKEEELRAQEFLERCKFILEGEPGRLVL